jgi:PIN domain nuclease of toxin-antitoxin system
MTLRILLDTHAYLWWLNDDANLSISARDCIADTDSIVHISAATVWEVSVKSAAGRLDLGETDVLGAIEANGFTELPITARHAAHAAWLPRHHGDPFDRLLIAQALVEGLTLVSSDRAFAAYDVPLLT